MSDISGHLRTTFGDNISMLLQQKGSKLRPFVMEGHYKGKAASVVDQYGPTVAKKRTGRFAPKTPANTPTDRRWVYPTPYDWMDLVDSFDKLQTVTDPTSAFVQNATMALGRGMDDEILNAMFADAKTGEQGGTTTVWPANTQKVGKDVGGAGSGLNVTKLRAAKKLLMAAEVDLESDPITMAISAEEHDDLLGEVQVVSTEFNDKPVLVDGKITRFLGINFVHCERVAIAGTVRQLPLWAKSGVHLGIWEDVHTDISIRKDLEGDPTQVSADMTLGATRTEEKKVVMIESVVD